MEFEVFFGVYDGFRITSLFKELREMTGGIT